MINGDLLATIIVVGILLFGIFVSVYRPKIGTEEHSNKAAIIFLLVIVIMGAVIFFQF